MLFCTPVVWLPNSVGEQFTPRHSDIDQLVISQLPQIVTCREYWCTIFQAVLGLSTTACSSHNWQSVFRYWLSGRGRGPPVWKTLLNALEASNIVELQRIANCLKARLHGTWSMLKHTGMLDLYWLPLKYSTVSSPLPPCSRVSATLQAWGWWSLHCVWSAPSSSHPRGRGFDFHLTGRIHSHQQWWVLTVMRS